LEDKGKDECYWEIQKFLLLALKANPNILECLYTPLIEHTTELGRELLSIRQCFLSKLVYQTFNGYVLSQFKKLEQDVRSRGEIRWKHAMHLIRLLRVGIGTVRESNVQVRVTTHRDELLSIKAGEWSWGDVNALRLELHSEFETAYSNSPLPERPDYEVANDFLVKARRHAARQR